MTEETKALVTGNGLRHMREGGGRFAVTGYPGVMLIAAGDGQASVRMVLVDPEARDEVLMMSEPIDLEHGQVGVLTADSLYSWPLRMDEGVFETASSQMLRIVTELISGELKRSMERGAPTGFLERVWAVIHMGEESFPFRNKGKGR